MLALSMSMLLSLIPAVRLISVKIAIGSLEILRWFKHLMCEEEKSLLCKIVFVSVVASSWFTHHTQV
ncbi:hypothetical protein JOB18_007607 [Solea senegalensis]|uniref:Secreted protein n=1 Tax=Solea senegalensis TaxID=28829 RepID=A0AAV6QT12_SOLSE|nr:hypothetical protein JOB18_007607 [Solea senegalensis]